MSRHPISATGGRRQKISVGAPQARFIWPRLRCRTPALGRAGPRSSFCVLPCLLSTSVSRCVPPSVCVSSLLAEHERTRRVSEFLFKFLFVFSCPPFLCFGLAVGHDRNVGSLDARRHAPSSSASARACSRPKVQLFAFRGAWLCFCHILFHRQNARQTNASF